MIKKAVIDYLDSGGWLTDALRLLKDQLEIYDFEFYGKRYDLGNKTDCLKTTFDVALMRDEFRGELLQYIKNKIKEK
jgi:UTP--glucose-1-phosphate uridylyltransferase